MANVRKWSYHDLHFLAIRSKCQVLQRLSHFSRVLWKLNAQKLLYSADALMAVSLKQCFSQKKNSTINNMSEFLLLKNHAAEIQEIEEI